MLHSLINLATLLQHKLATEIYKCNFNNASQTQCWIKLVQRLQKSKSA